VDYDLHPEYPVRMKKPHGGQCLHLINSRDDFWIRVRCAMAWSSGVGYRMRLSKRTQMVIRRLNTGALRTCKMKRLKFEARNIGPCLGPITSGFRTL
jgi:hypothetical protein